MDDRRQSGLWAQNQQSGFYEQQQQQGPRSSTQGPYKYYEPPPPRLSEDHGRTYADRANGASGVLRSDSRKIKDKLPTKMTDGLHKLKQLETSTTTSEQLAQTQHVNSVRAPGSSTQEPLRIDPNAVPQNIRTKPWSPDIISPRTREPTRGDDQPLKGRQTSTASNASELLRRSSVPDRSPLQKLESELASKEEKRARVEEAEARARQKSLGGEGAFARQGTLRSSRDGRVVSNESRQPERADSYRRHEEGRPRHVSADQPESGANKFRRASENLRKEVSPPLKQEHYAPLDQRESRRDDKPRANDARYYAPAPERRQDAPAVKEPQAQRRQPDSVAQQVSPRQKEDTRADGNVRRTGSEKYKHRARDAGFAGAAAAMAGVGAATAADRGKAAHERRKSQMMGSPQASPISPVAPDGGFRRDEGLGRSGSKKLQKRPPPATEWHGKGESGFRGPADQAPEDERDLGEARPGKQQLLTDRMNSKRHEEAAAAHQEPDPVPREQVATSEKDPVNYRIPPQTASGQQARQQVGFGAETSSVHAQQQGKHHHFGGVFHKNHEHQVYQRDAKALDEWRTAKTARLTSEDLEYDREPSATAGATAVKDAAWWEAKDRRTSSSGSKQPALQAAQYDGPYEEEATRFRPPLYLKCGPLLRYTGMRRESDLREIWRGSIMIVTEDEQSDYSSVPTLRIFAQKMDLHQPPSKEMLESGHELQPEYEDPVAGQAKLSRTGRPLYVRPVHDIQGGVDLSREENPQGLYAATRTPLLGPQSSSGPDGRESKHITFQDKSRVKRNSGEKAGKHREVKAARLHCERGYTFWRFNIEIELASHQHRVAYRINKGPAIGFWVPARGDTMNIMFHSCNGFSMSVKPDDFSGPDPMWRDVMNRHQSRPFHVMIGGGDQIYNDAAMRECELFSEWCATKNPEHKHSADFSPELQDELETFYLNRYAMWFSQGLFAMANSQIPMVNIWDDHDIMDGYGSYPHAFMSSPVFTGLGAVAFKYYMLFQHQSVAAETAREEPSWLLGPSPGPYINQPSRNVFVHLGRKVALVGLDCRTERMRDEILCQETYDVVFDRMRHEIDESDGDVKHLIVLLGVPIAYPRLNFLENILTSRVMDPIKAIGRTGMLGGFVNKFDGGVEILDDLDDHWTAKHHKAERNWFIQELQQFAAEKSVRVTILGGDVHLGAVGQFYTSKKFGLSKDRDHRYMPNIISSAIVNTPPPNMMADVLNRRNKVHHLDDETDEDMIPMFDHDVDGTRRANKHLLPRRNYCTIREYAPGSTPPPSPRHEEGPRTPMSGDDFPEPEPEQRDRRFPPGSMRRTMSLTRGPANLVRRLSGSGRSKNAPVPLAPEHSRPYDSHTQDSAPGMQRSNSMGAPRPDEGSYFPPNQRPTNQFHRRPTSLSIKEARKAAGKGGADGTLDGQEAGHINLEGGLDISLMMEMDQHDPSGITVPYRLLVPALWYEGAPDMNTTQFKGRRASLMNRIRGRLGRGHEIGGDGYSRTPSPGSPPDYRDTQQSAPGVTDSDEAQLGRHGNTRPQQMEYEGDGAADARRHVSSPPTQDSTHAYNKGYNLSSPPIGSAQPERQLTNSNQYPQPGNRRASAPTKAKQQPANEPWRQQDERSEGSLTPSDEYDDRPPATRPGMQGRRPSKAERFFGIGDDGGPWGGSGARKSSYQQDGGYEDEDAQPRQKPKWMIWK